MVVTRFLCLIPYIFTSKPLFYYRNYAITLSLAASFSFGIKGIIDVGSNFFTLPTVNITLYPNLTSFCAVESFPLSDPPVA